MEIDEIKLAINSVAERVSTKKKKKKNGVRIK
jgi:hypothetical protein